MNRKLSNQEETYRCFSFFGGVLRSNRTDRVGRVVVDCDVCMAALEPPTVYSLFTALCTGSFIPVSLTLKLNVYEFRSTNRASSLVSSFLVGAT